MVSETLVGKDPITGSTTRLVVSGAPGSVNVNMINVYGNIDETAGRMAVREFNTRNMFMSKDIGKAPATFFKDGNIFRTGQTELSRVATINRTVEEFGPINIDGWFMDQVTPKIVEYQMWSEYVEPEAFASALRKSIPESIKKLYSNRNDGTWPPNAPNWLKRKRRDYGESRPMHLTDKMKFKNPLGFPLADAVKAVHKHIKVIPGSTGIVVTGLEEAFSMNQYVWLHETGYTNQDGTGVPQRAFISPAVDEASAQSIKWVMSRTPATRGSTETMTWNTKPGSYQTSLTRTFRGMSKWLWWFMPPSHFWKYLGWYADIKGIVQGHFLSPSVIARFAWAFGRGKASGMTGIPFSEKFARRRFRYKIWT